jgi:hypothetical protein
MVHENEVAHAEATPAETSKLLESQSAVAKRIRASGAYVDGERIRPSAEGKRVRRRGGKVEVTSGPFTENGRALSGYCLVETDSLEKAVDLAKEVPTLASDEIEVRPAMKCHVMQNKTDKPGKVFAFAVLGNEPSEAAWKKTMDRIDEETSHKFPQAEFLGGMRLEPPTTGRTIKGNSRTVMDGPFFESKEVIGGLCFLRFANMDEAVRWASETPFVVHGTLEIRELWRS